jgi:hypothetical protein
MAKNVQTVADSVTSDPKERNLDIAATPGEVHGHTQLLLHPALVEESSLVLVRKRSVLVERDVKVMVLQPKVSTCSCHIWAIDTYRRVLIKDANGCARANFSRSHADLVDCLVGSDVLGVVLSNGSAAGIGQHEAALLGVVDDLDRLLDNLVGERLQTVGVVVGPRREGESHSLEVDHGVNYANGGHIEGRRVGQLVLAGFNENILIEEVGGEHGGVQAAILHGFY